MLFALSRTQKLKLGTGKYVQLKKEYRRLGPSELKQIGVRSLDDLYCWDRAKERVTKGSGNWERINAYLDGEKEKINKTVLNLELMNIPLSVDSFRNAYLKPNGNKEFEEYFLREVESRRHLMAGDTYRGYKALINKVSKYRPGISLSDINYKFLTGFENYMMKPVSEKGLGNVASTVAKSMTLLRALLNMAIKNKDLLKESYPFKDYTIKHVDAMLTTRDYLEPEDLLKVEQQLSPENISKYNSHQIQAIKRFLFGCYTGLRFADVNKLNWKQHIHTKWIINPATNVTSLRSYIYLEMNKTSNPVLIPLIDKALEIMGDKKEGNVFEKISNQKINKHLKALNDKAGLNKKLSFHVSRHSFATICFLYGIPEKVGQKLLGHKNRKFTEIYTHLSSNRLFYEMDKLNRGISEYDLVADESDVQREILKEMLPVLKNLSPEKLEQLKGIVKLLGK
jgi:integrase